MSVKEGFCNNRPQFGIFQGQGDLFLKNLCRDEVTSPLQNREQQKMKQRHFSVQFANRNLRYKRHAAIASIGLHLLFVIIAAFLFSGHRELNKDAFEATIVTLNPSKTDIEIRPTRRVVSNTPLLRDTSTETRIPTQAAQISQLSISETQVARDVPPLDVETNMLNPTEVAVAPTLPKSETLKTSSVHSSITLSEEAPAIEKGASSAVRSRGTGTTQTGLSDFLDGSLPTGDLGDGFDTAFRNLVKVPKEKLGGVLEGTGTEIRGHIRLIRLKHSLSDWWQDPTAIPALIKWLAERTPIRADMDFAGGALRLTDPQIMDAPLIIMTGHDKDSSMIAVSMDFSLTLSLMNSNRFFQSIRLRFFLTSTSYIASITTCRNRPQVVMCSGETRTTHNLRSSVTRKGLPLTTGWR